MPALPFDIAFLERLEPGQANEDSTQIDSFSSTVKQLMDLRFASSSLRDIQ